MATPARLRTRFAPSPTGYLHLGHVAHMIYVWGAARALGAEVVLRMEDHDRTRCRPEFEAAILDDLDWLGFVPDVAPTSEFRTGRSDYRQSDCDAFYREALEQLRAKGLVYGCRCSRRDIQVRVGVQYNEVVYDGYCRNESVDMAARDVGVRVCLPDRDCPFEDHLLGPQSQNPANQCGDLLIRDRHACWTYQYCVVLDDARHGVNLVVRGADLLASTGRQRALQGILGLPLTEQYLHHPLIADAEGRKLSKKDLATPIQSLRAAGWKSEAVLGHAAYRVGLTETDGAMDVAEAVGRVVVSK